ncbi:biotin--[acetyl-CoA-carboxylase] ligase [Belnapia rosea]|uniref:BirA family transcriptional regulator, biotin operon repressor / biotin-[acetyl-CoA-carboxylase] ligase n=1 Tax=Belnapia rosea TaxID=938405 RepID=A0A1G6XN32_9PROT|nr:biotin--[acetyl-CoA-carboxylase] ligase [Belnapia rosea]SDB69915.1 BirA family transcriptional regulator, biotin operon repressor / biotin-[acetyl-CoA-carboxylase] ligase [Belnapia rosea]SDD79619.1 BirA family transcriptional regulator, biotin operon repressor / biotin-[acetyl-CoA-carboxylase] ligase [Belnapia rosea]
MTLPPGWRLEVHEALSSTSDRIGEAADAGEAAGLAVLARRQTAGRGRSGRAWASPIGNMYLSMLLRPSGPVRGAAQWSLLAGVALAEAARQIDPAPELLRLKWPNDLLRDGVKCAGILTETALSPEGSLAWLSFGIGVNLTHAPSLPDRPTTCLGAAEPPEVFAQRLIARLDYWCRRQAEEGFAPVRAAWVALGPALGTRLALRDGPIPEGNFLGLEEDGAILLEWQGRRHAIRSGELGSPA